MKRAGISKSVVLSIATKPTQTENINNWSAEIQDEEIIALEAFIRITKIGRQSFSG